jgi:hypothetical protein
VRAAARGAAPGLCAAAPLLCSCSAPPLAADRLRPAPPASGAGAGAGGGDKATAKLLGAALGGASDAGDVELGVRGITTTCAPRWVEASERARGEMVLLRDRIAKLRE